MMTTAFNPLSCRPVRKQLSSSDDHFISSQLCCCSTPHWGHCAQAPTQLWSMVGGVVEESGDLGWPDPAWHGFSSLHRHCALNQPTPTPHHFWILYNPSVIDEIWKNFNHLKKGCHFHMRILKSIEWMSLSLSLHWSSSPYFIVKFVVRRHILTHHQRHSLLSFTRSS